MTAKTQKLTTATIGKLSFEEALAELESIVKRLESGRETLDTAIDDYTVGTALKKHCEKKLSEAQLKVEKLMVDADGNVSSQPFEA